MSTLATYYAPDPKRWCCLTSVCRSVAYIGPKSRTERPRKTKIGTEVAHVTCDSDTTFEVKRSKVKVTMPLYSPRRLHIRQLQRSPWERIHHGNLLLRCRLQARRSARRREALRRPQREDRGGGISWRPTAYSLLMIVAIPRIVVVVVVVVVEYLYSASRSASNALIVP